MHRPPQAGAAARHGNSRSSLGTPRLYLLTKEILDNLHNGMEAYRRSYNSILRFVDDWVERSVEYRRDQEEDN